MGSISDQAFRYAAAASAVLALREQHIAAAVGGERRELRAVDRVELLEGVVVLGRVEQQAGETQPGDRPVLVLPGVVGDPGEARLRRVVLTLLGGDARREEPALLGEGRARIAVLHVGEDPRRALAVDGLRGALELVEQRAGLRALVALVQVPAVPCRERAEDERPAPR